MHSHGVPQQQGDPVRVDVSQSQQSEGARYARTLGYYNIGRLHRPFAKKYGNDIAVDLIEH